MSGLTAESSWTALLPGFLVAGVGVGLLNPVIADVAVSVVPKERSGMAAGINDTFRQVGVAVGVAAWGAIFLGRGADKISTLAAGTPAATNGHPRQLLEAASDGRLGSALAAVPHAARGVVASATREGFLTGLNAILLIGGLIAIAGAAIAAVAGARAPDRARGARARHRPEGAVRSTGSLTFESVRSTSRGALPSKFESMRRAGLAS